MINPKIVRIGDQYMMLLDPEILKALKIHANTPHRLKVEDDKLIITPIRSEAPKLHDPKLQTIVENILDEYEEAF